MIAASLASLASDASLSSDAPGTDAMRARPLLSAGGRVLIPADATLAVARVPVHDVRIPDNYCGMDLGHVAEMAGLMGGNLDGPPVLLAADGLGGWWLVEGRHRFLSAVAAGRSDVLAVTADRVHLTARPEVPRG